MKHYLAFRFNKDVEYRKIKEVFHTAYKNLTDSISGLNSYEIQENTIDRKTNFHLMIVMDLDNHAVLDEYLSHQIHQDLINTYTSSIEQVMTFDCE